MRKRLLFAVGLALVLAVLGVVGGYVLLWLSAPRITRANFERIELGMMGAQVDAILGAAGDYSTDESTADPVQGPASVTATKEELAAEPPLPHLGRWAARFVSGSAKEWKSDHGIVFVDFDASGRVTDKAFIAVQPMTGRPTFLDKIRRWLGL